MLTTTFLVKRRPDLEFGRFRRHSVEVHAPLVASLPGLRRYVVSFYPATRRRRRRSTRARF